MTDAQFTSGALVQSFAVKGALQALAGFDFTPGYELDRRLKADPKLLAEFVNDPEGVAKREVNLVVPNGWHMHFINDKNEYMPAEGDAVSLTEDDGVLLVPAPDLERDIVRCVPDDEASLAPRPRHVRGQERKHRRSGRECELPF